MIISTSSPSIMEYWIAVLVVVAISCLFLHLYHTNGRKVPPSPWGVPILGHLHMLSELPHHNLFKLAKRYGAIMQIRLGHNPYIVVSSPEAAELFLKTHDIIFANRPKFQASDIIPDMGFSTYGPKWRHVRMLCAKHLLSSSNVESMKSIREEYVKNIVMELVRGSSQGSEVVDLSAKVRSNVADMTLEMIIGAGKDARLDFKSSLDDLFRLAGAFNIGDYVPFVGRFDLQGIVGRLKDVSRRMDGYLQDIIDEHVQNSGASEDHNRDLVGRMLSVKSREEHDLDRDTIKLIILQMISGAMDTSSTVIEWALSDLLRHPRVMKLVESELENVVGLNRMVEDSDLMRLEYLDCVLKESMRLHPVAPLLVPHESSEDITINGYLIPKKSRILVNAWAIGHDQQVWSDNVDEFYPERFIGSNIDFKGHDLRFIPFGSGRRGCPGILLGLAVVRLVIAQLVHCFNWELPNGMSPEELDMKEKSGLTVQRANNILAIPTSRLNIHKPKIL